MPRGARGTPVRGERVGTATGDLSHLGGQGCSRQGSCPTARAEISSCTLGTALYLPHWHPAPTEVPSPPPLPLPLNPPGPWRKQLKPRQAWGRGGIGGTPCCWLHLCPRVPGAEAPKAEEAGGRQGSFPRLSGLPACPHLLMAATRLVNCPPPPHGAGRMLPWAGASQSWQFPFKPLWITLDLGACQEG